MYFRSKPSGELMSYTLETRPAEALQGQLLKWYSANKREMPWRESSDPYRIWISEIMLQQTQVKTVTPYFDRFLTRFPDVAALACASIHDVMKQWEGLGYYSRARHMHRAAKVIMAEYDGKIPDTYDELIALPGIGRYTAGAVLSIAFGKKVPVVDGNVIRVLTRIFHITDSTGHSETIDRLWELAEALLPDAQVGAFNQALMELGALICRKTPECGRCPVSGRCEARRLSIQDELPVRPPRRRIPHYDVTAGVIYSDGLLLITLRPPKGLLGGLWEFPGGKVEPGETLTSCLVREISEELNIRIAVDSPLISVEHAYTHFRITLHVFICRYLSGELKTIGCDDYRWIRTEELDGFAFPAADRKVIEKLKQKEKVL